MVDVLFRAPMLDRAAQDGVQGRPNPVARFWVKASSASYCVALGE